MILTLESGINAPSFVSIFALCDFTIVSSYMKLLNGQPQPLYILYVYPSLVLFLIFFLYTIVFLFLNTQAELIMEASVVRSGRNVTVVAVEFKFNDTGKLVCASRATFYNTPIAKLWTFQL